MSSAIGGNAFVGFSLDSDLFSREWLRKAISHILSERRCILFVLADRLLAFNKSVQVDEQVGLVLDLRQAEERITKRRSDIHLFLKSEVSRLAPEDQSRIAVSSWSECADGQFAHNARVLSIAYSALKPFRECVDRDVERHFVQQNQARYPTDVYRRLCALYVIEETAMIIRITEDNHPFEYYPREHIQTLTELYAGRFSSFGLTVESLIHRPKTRIFTPLPLV